MRLDEDWNLHGGDNTCIQNFGFKAWMEDTVGGLGSRRKDNIKMTIRGKVY